MEEQKILFADLYRLTDTLKGEVKELGKHISFVMSEDDWSRLTLTVNGLVSSAELIEGISRHIVKVCDLFLHGGPYAGQGAGRLPLEGMAEDA